MFQSLKGLPWDVNIFIWLLNVLVSILILFVVIKTLLSCLITISCFVPLKVYQRIVDHLLPQQLLAVLKVQF